MSLAGAGGRCGKGRLHILDYACASALISARIPAYRQYENSEKCTLPPFRDGLQSNALSSCPLHCNVAATRVRCRLQRGRLIEYRHVKTNKNARTREGHKARVGQGGNISRGRQLTSSDAFCTGVEARWISQRAMDGNTLLYASSEIFRP